MKRGRPSRQPIGGMIRDYYAGQAPGARLVAVNLKAERRQVSRHIAGHLGFSRAAGDQAGVHGVDPDQAAERFVQVIAVDFQWHH